MTPAPLPEGHHPMSEPDLNAIRAAAEAATPGPWLAGRPFIPEMYWAIEAPQTTRRTVAGTASGLNETDATYIATMDPQTTLALIARAENAEQERARAIAAVREADGALWTLRGIAFDQIQADFDSGSAQAWWAT